MPNRAVFRVAPVLAIAVAACAGGAPPPHTGSPSTTPASASPTVVAGIGHPTGATDVVLRFDEGGGFVNPASLVSQTPIFTLYGDGSVVFRDTSAAPLPMDGSVVRERQLRTARLDERQVQSLLESALNEAGLGAAREKYEQPQVADAPTTTFTIHVVGLSKTVQVYALGIEGQGGLDAGARAAFAHLAERLRNFDNGGAFATQPYLPVAYRGILMDAGGQAVSLVAWPWSDLKPSDFVAPTVDDGAPSFPRRTLTPDEAAAVGIAGIEGGVNGVMLAAPDGSSYGFALRPLLPDETT